MPQPVVLMPASTKKVVAHGERGSQQQAAGRPPGRNSVQRGTVVEKDVSAAPSHRRANDAATVTSTI